MAVTSKKPPKFSISEWTGWRRTATYLTILVTVLTIFLIGILIASLYGTGSGSVPLQEDTIIWETDCNTTSLANLWIHFAINVIATGVLGSSNFFMQVLVAPTRKEVDRAHARSKWVDIGVHSVRNFRFLSRYKVILWLLFSLSSVPLHLIFNGCVIETKASAGFKVLMVAEGFLNGAPWSLPPVISETTTNFIPELKPDAEISTRIGLQFNPDVINRSENTISSIRRSAIRNDAHNWESIDYQDCFNRYNRSQTIGIYGYRHVIAVVRNSNETSTVGWTREQLTRNTTGFDDADSINSLWVHDSFLHLDATARTHDDSRWRGERRWISGLSASSYISDSIVYNENSTFWNTLYPYRPDLPKLIIDHCLLEKHQIPCRLSIANRLLLVVCIMCSLKCLLCAFTLVTLGIWRDEDHLITPGDAIASFISRPDDGTKDMCTISFRRHGETCLPKGYHVTYPDLRGSWRWVTILKRTAGQGGPRTIWNLSFVLVWSVLITAMTIFLTSLEGQSIQDSRFEHHPANAAFEGDMLRDMSFIGLTMVANVPQVILSVFYMTLNGLITRMLVEFEWSQYSTGFRSLRVTDPIGHQRSTYRLQLPYRLSIPILSLSALLHWVYSNCIYVSHYDYYDPDAPYHIVGTSSGLQYSTMAILIALLLSFGITTTPAILSRFRLPGNIVLGGSNSTIISAACHCIPTGSSVEAPKPLTLTIETMAVVDAHTDMESLLTADDSFNVDTSEITDADKLRSMATKKLKWGQVSDGSDSDGVGHLAFGVEDQEVTEPIDGNLYR